MKALIFGVAGQDGFYLKRLIEEKKITVIGVSRSGGPYLKGDVADTEFVSSVIRKECPDYIFHLAANSTTHHDGLFENHRTISTGTLNILESALKFSRHSKIFLSGSGLQFVNMGLPIKETDPFYGGSPYAVERIHSVYAARYFRTLGVKVYLGYFFNHDSPLRSERHLNQRIVMAAKRIAGGSGEKLELGDISVRKEFSFAGDIAGAVWQLVNNDTVFEATIGSGQAFSIQDWLDICFGRVNVDWKTVVLPNPLWKKEYDVLVSDPATIFGLGWSPRVDIIQLADMMFNK
jgi:GDPmannose 4,6-dehydratase